MVAQLKFAPGRVVVTENASRNISNEEVINALCRHLQGDRSDFGGLGQVENELGRLQGCRLLSAYRSAEGLRFWIITEADRTTVLLSEDFG